MVVYDLNKNLAESVRRFPDSIAMESRINGYPETFTYRQFYENVRGIAYHLYSIGIRRSDRVGIILENSPEWAMIFFASSYLGAIAVPLDPQMTGSDVKNIIADAEVKAILLPQRYSPKLDFLKSYAQLIYIEEVKGHIDAPEEFEKMPMLPGDVAVILYTSGTTDVPKGVMLTHKNLCANFCSLKKLGIFSERDVILSVLPLYHSYSLMTTLIVPLFSGARVVYVGEDWSERLGEYIKETGTTVFIGVPKIYQLMRARIIKRIKDAHGIIAILFGFIFEAGLCRFIMPGLRDAFGKKFRFFVSGGARLDPEIAKDFFKLGFKILEGYGLTETSPVVSFNPLKRPRIGSIGKPIPDVEMDIFSPDQNGIGEIVIKGPNVMKGYYKKEDRTKEVIKDGWFFSGDLGYVDKDGYFYITGRCKEVIVLSSGKNIYPEEIEKYYLRSPYIKEMCVLGMTRSHPRGKVEYLHAVIVPDFDFFKERGEMNIESVIKNTINVLSKELPSYKHIMGFTITDEPLPRTILGKIKRYEVYQKIAPVLSGDRKPDVSAEDNTLLELEITKKVISCIKDSAGIDRPIHLNDSIELDLGVDSLGRVELVLSLEKALGIEFPEEMIAGDIFTVKDVVLKVKDLVEKRTEKNTLFKKEEGSVSWVEILKQDLSPESKTKILLNPGLGDYILTFLVKGFINIFFRVFYGLRVEGGLSLPKKGPYILCVNHTSFLDGFIVVASVPFRLGLELFFIAFRRYFIVPVIRNFVKRARIIPVDATQIIEAMQWSAYVLRNDKILCIFPEGERSIDGNIKEFKKGVGIVADELNVGLVPVYINGAFEAWPRTRRFPRIHPIKVKFGKMFYSSILAEKGISLLGAKDRYEAICMAIREELIKLGG